MFLFFYFSHLFCNFAALIVIKHSTDMPIKTTLYSLLMLLLPLTALAQKVTITASYNVREDDVLKPMETSGDFEGEAPLDVSFAPVCDGIGDHTPAYEWHFRKEGATQDLLVRYDEQTQYTFTESGAWIVTLKTRLTDIGADLDSTSIKVTISESKLEFPNAFSPNDDKVNDIYRAKQPDGVKSIVEFHAYIFNRWGQKLYEWTDPYGGWDGNYKGNPVKEGVYFVLVKARGADGREYNIRKDVNLLRTYIQSETNSSSQ